jgi:hypothetical protein
MVQSDSGFFDPGDELIYGRDSGMTPIITNTNTSTEEEIIVEKPPNKIEV